MGVVNGDYERLLDEPFEDGLLSLVAAAHELKSPLALIRQLSLMLDEGEISFDEYKRIVKQITLTSERALRLTSDLTKSVRLNDALFELEPINPNQLCSDIVCELRPLFAAHNCSLRLVAKKQPALLVANRDLLRRIVMNFSDNALHYADDNNLVELKICSLNSGNVIRLGVRDHGPALPADVFRKLRAKLSSAPTPIHARPQSSGLGLYISGQFADIMNGKIGVVRHRDGATFYVDLQASSQLSLL